jgi:hypothetical protein
MMDCALGSGSLVLDAAKHLVRPPAASLDDEAELPSEWLVKERVRSCRLIKESGPFRGRHKRIVSIPIALVVKRPRAPARPA